MKDACAERNQEPREKQRGAGKRVPALNWEVCSKYMWQPDLQPKLKDWVADFACARPSPGLQCCLARQCDVPAYYLGLTPYDRARHF